jgi:hypothetical protein
LRGDGKLAALCALILDGPLLARPVLDCPLLASS